MKKNMKNANEEEKIQKVYEIDLREGSWESLALIAKALKDKGKASLKEVAAAALAATTKYNEVVNKERETSGKIYGGFRLDEGRLIAWVNGKDYRMDSFLLEHWYVED